MPLELILRLIMNKVFRIYIILNHEKAFWINILDQENASTINNILDHEQCILD